MPYSTVILHKRLLALLNAFGLGSPKQFARGEFVKAPFEGYSLAMAELRKKVHSGNESFLNVDGFVEHELRHLFAQLLRHRTFATRLLGAVSYDEAGTPSAGAVVRMTHEANLRVVGALLDIDDLLLELISPTDEIFDEADVIARHGHIDDHTLTQAFADEW